MQAKQLPIEEILADAISIGDADARRQFVEAACGDDSALRDKVERLIENHFQAGSFLEMPAGVPTADAAAAVVEGPRAVIGPYKLLEQIGEGGFGVVFMAEQERPVRRKVALKIIKPGMDTKQVIARFEAERQALALMDHPNIAKVLDAAATDSGRPYFVMELIKGIPITEYCDQNRLPPRERLQLFICVCQAVQHAHQKGIIHRDIKPSNVLVTLHDGTPVVKVIDFGIAKATGQQLTERTLFTNFAQLMGTPLYMSPEQATLGGLDIDTRCDVYALGVLLYELLTGTTPFEKERLRQVSYDEIRRLIREEEPPRPSTRLSTLGQAGATISAQRQCKWQQLCVLVRGELDWIVMKALEKDRNRRYESANALAADVARHLKDEPVQACPPSSLYLLRKFVRRHKVALTTTSLVAAALVLGTAVSIWQAVEADDARWQADQAADRERKMAAETRQKQLETARLLAGHQLDEGLKRLNEGNTDGLFDLLSARETAEDLPELRDVIERFWAIAHSRLQDRLTRVLPSANNVAFSPDGKLLAVMGGNRASLVDVVTGQVRCSLMPLGHYCEAMVFSPDGRLLATHTAVSGARLWDTATGLPVGKPLSHSPASGGANEKSPNSVAFSPDGKLVATGGLDGTVRLWEARTGEPRGAPWPHGPKVIAVAFSPDGKWLVSGGTEATVRLWDVSTGKARGGALQADGFVFKIMFTSDGGRFITVSTGGVMLWETQTGRLVRRLLDGWLTDASLAPDSKILAVGDVGGQVLVVDLQALQVLGRILPDHEGRIESVVFSPDGKWLAATSRDGATAIYEIKGRTPFALAIAWSGEAGRAAWSPDSKLLATPWGLKIWRVAERALRTMPLRLSSSVALSPDEKRLALCIRPHGKSRVFIQDTTAGSLVDFSRQGSCTCLAFSPDGSLLAIGNMGWNVELWDKNGKQVGGIHTNDRPYGLAWSPDGTRIVAATRFSRQVTEYDSGTGKAIGQSFTDAGRARAVCYSPDASMIAELGNDQSASVIRLWSTRLGPRHPPLILANNLPGGQSFDAFVVNFSRDGKLLAVQWPAGEPVLFRLPPALDLNQMRLQTWCALATRRDSNGQVHAIPADEWSKLRHELSSLDQTKRPIHWDELETAFENELVRQAQKIDRAIAKLPADAAEHAEVARFCQEGRQLYAAAARFFSEAFTREPKLADELMLNRYNAACSAALAGCGQGKDAANLKPSEYARLRGQAINWLRAELAAYQSLLKKEPAKDRSKVVERLLHWQRDPDFNGVRGAAALAKLPEAERREWQMFWEGVAALEKQASDSK